MIAIPRTVQIIFAICIFFIFYASAYAEKPYQIVQIQSNEDNVVKSGETIIVYATYNVSDGQKVTGIGIQIHYNSNFLRLLSIDSTYPEGEQGYITKKDANNDDDDLLTNRAIVMAWSSLGGNTWPYKELPIELMRMTLQVQDVGESEMTQINVIDTSTPGDYTFQGKNLHLFINSTKKLDINDDGFFNMIDVLQTFKHVIQN